MKRIAPFASIAVLVVAALPALASAQANSWDFDPSHTHASFTVRHLGVSNVRGEFRKVTGKAVIDEKDITKSSVEATIDANSVDTRVEKRDNHLRSPDFFNVAKNPTLTFKSTKVEKAGDGKLKVTGDLTMNGVTKPVVLDVDGPGPVLKTPWGTLVRAVEAHAKVNRRDFGLNWNNMVEAVQIVGDEVSIELEVELNRPASPQASK